MSRARLAICYDTAGWWKRFEKAARTYDISYELVEIERADWLERLHTCSHVIWRPNLDGPFAEEGKEKLYYLDRVLGKRTFPGWSTFWHYDNKRAQCYLFATFDVRAPRTFVSFSEQDAREFAARAAYPLVSKTSAGASAQGVRLLGNQAQAQAEIREVFHAGVVARGLRKFGMDFRGSPRTRNGYVLWQEFIPDNSRDLRVTVIGKERAFAFWRNNRPNDFRASGSGLIDYDVGGVEAECLYCIELCRRLDFDVMAFDLVYRGDQFTIVEMSYTFVDRAIRDAPWHFQRDRDGGLTRIEGNVWPQDLLMEYVRRSIVEHDAQRTSAARELSDPRAAD